MCAMVKKTILLVEDDFILSSTEKKMIETMGYIVIVANTGEEALEIFQNNQIQLILMDIDLGLGIDGTEVAEKILKDHDIPIVFLSSHTEPEIVEKTEKITSYGYVVKGTGITILDASIKMAFKLFDSRKKELEKEKALFLRESYLSAIIENQPGLLWLKDSNGRFLSVNMEFAKSCGFDNSELLLGKTDFDIWPQELAVKYIADDVSVMKSGIPIMVEEPISDKGNIKWFETFKTPVLDNRGVIVGTTGYARDITERKRNDEILIQNEARLKRLVNILQHNSETIQEFLDYALGQAIQLTESKVGYIYHYNEESKEFILNTWSKEVMKECSIINPSTCYKLEKTGIWGEAVRQRKPIIVNDFQSENPLKKGYPEGHVKLSNFMTIPIFDNDKIVCVVGLANKESDYNKTDILQTSLLMEAVWKVTTKMKAEDTLRNNEEKIRTIFEIMSDGIALNECIYNENGEMIDYRIIEVNQAFYSIADYESGPVIGNVATKLYGMSIDIIKSFWEIHKNKNTVLRSEYYSPISNKCYWVSASPIINDRFVTLFVDITERKRSEAALNNRYKG